MESTASTDNTNQTGKKTRKPEELTTALKLIY
jgi:hypothetical protein